MAAQTFLHSSPWAEVFISIQVFLASRWLKALKVVLR